MRNSITQQSTTKCEREVYNQISQNYEYEGHTILELVVYTDFTGMFNRQYGIPVRLSIPVYSVYFKKVHRKVPKFSEGKELLINILADTCEVEYTLVPNTKGKSEL